MLIDPAGGNSVAGSISPLKREKTAPDRFLIEHWGLAYARASAIADPGCTLAVRLAGIDTMPRYV
jgi:hypothetical protein